MLHPLSTKKVKTIKHKDRKLNETFWHFLLPAIAFHNYYTLTYNIYLRTQTIKHFTHTSQ